MIQECEPKAAKESDRADSSFAELLRDLRDDGWNLIRQEVALAKLEITGNVRQAAGLVGMALAGALIALTGIAALVLTVAALIAWGGIAAGASPASAVALGLGITGTLASAGGLALLRYAWQKLQSHPILPDETIENLKQDARCIHQSIL